MKAKKSESLLLVWQIAELHARQLNAVQIEPHHILLALAKIVDMDLTAFVGKDTTNHDEVLEQLLREVRRVRTVFSTGNFDARSFRRRLRAIGNQDNTSGRLQDYNSEILHRSDTTKRVFLEAAHFATLSEETVYPVHLLLAVLSTPDKYYDPLMKELGIDKNYIQEIAKRELFKGQNVSQFPRLGQKGGRN